MTGASPVNSAVALGWWLDCEDESGESEMRVITTLRLW